MKHGLEINPRPHLYALYDQRTVGILDPGARMIANCWLRPGHTQSAHNASAFLDNAIENLGGNPSFATMARAVGLRVTLRPVATSRLSGDAAALPGQANAKNGEQQQHRGDDTPPHDLAIRPATDARVYARTPPRGRARESIFSRPHPPTPIGVLMNGVTIDAIRAWRLRIKSSTRCGVARKRPV